jgi:hypothetical protein
MNVTISIEKYVFLEVMNTLEVAISWVSGVNRDTFKLQKQWKKLAEALHLFMLDVEMVEFKDLKLPSEQKPAAKQKQEPNPKSKLKGAKKKVKQLTLFFVKQVKKALFYTILAMELAVEKCKDKLVKNEPDFENRIRK